MLTLRRPSAILAAGLTLPTLWLGAPGAAPPVVVRGPYLQRVSDDEAIVRWRTDVACESVVQFGPSPAELTSLAGSGAGTEHRVVVTGLDPATVYYYSVGTGDQVLAGGDAEHRFRTAPPAGAPGPHRIWALGDYGTGGTAAQGVRDGFLAATGGAAPDAWITLGDNAYFSGTDAQLETGLFDTYPTLLRRTGFWPSFGNHDAISSDATTLTGPWFDAFSLPRQGQAGGLPSNTEAYYSFDHGNVHLVALDSADSDRSATGAMGQWLAADLAATTADWVIVYFHHAPYSDSSHHSDSDLGMREMREQLMPVIEAAGVDLVVAGHSHGYERSHLLDGHYGLAASFTADHVVHDGSGPEGDGAYRKSPGAHGGTLYAVAGHGGASLYTGTYAHPAMPVGMSVQGSLVLDVWSRRLEGRMIGADGAVHDRFVIYDGMHFGDGFESGDLAWWSSP